MFFTAMTLSVEFTQELQKNFQGELRTDLATRILYSTDASIYQMEPLGVAIPRVEEDLVAALELAAKYKIPILPRGSGSSLAGQAIGHALILDTSRWLDSVLEIDPEARTATIQPGVILSRLNKAAARHGLQFGPDPASAERATLGGVIGNNATGAHSIQFGMAADHILSAEVLLADGSPLNLGLVSVQELLAGGAGRLAPIFSAVQRIRFDYADEIRTHYPDSWRNSAGYRLNYLLPWSPSAPPQWAGEFYPANLPPSTVNLAALLAGSEGTLAVMRRLKVRLVPKPSHTVLAVLPYDSIAAACDDTPRLLSFRPSAVELIPRMLIRLAREVPAYARQMDFVEGDPAALLVVEFSGDDPAQLENWARSLGEDLRVATSLDAQNRIWSVRKVGLGILDSGPTAARPVAIIEDCAIPVENLGDFVRELDRILAAHGTTAAYYAHASAGCLHIRPLLDLRTDSGVRDLRGIAEATLALTLRLGGSMSSEHGDGVARSEFLRQTYGTEVMEAFRVLKTAFDPEGRLNPGKILDAPPMDANLRYGERYQARAWTPVFDFSRQNGLSGAIEQCNGAGVCRKAEGVMCPSFQVTREEQNATRGRANLLRALISSPLPEGPAPLQKAVYDALGLCLACKGCKAECPSGVDMAKLKYEFLHGYYRSRPRPLRDYLFGYINQLAPLGAPFGGLLNRALGMTLISTAFNAVFGLSAKRAFPRFSGARAGVSRAGGEPVLLLRDTFTHFFESEVERAALGVLAACGVSARPLSLFGAGRTLISKGFLPAAKHHAARLLNEVRRIDPAGTLPVLGLEPSEIYTLRDEFRDLLPGRSIEVEALAARAWMADEFLIRPAPGESAPRVERLRSARLESQPSVILHGHCYQKAQPPAADGYPVGQAATAALLRSLGYTVEVIASGCCGMAGAFGYEEEHYELSMAVGELALFPAVRGAPHSGVAAAGTSCRAQIADGAGRQAEHPLVLAARLLEES
jgi:FAD/FMN-containing dehydrogenase/Fe-S oxidoreductase